MVKNEEKSRAEQTEKLFKIGKTKEIYEYNNIRWNKASQSCSYSYLNIH